MNNLNFVNKDMVNPGQVLGKVTSTIIPGSGVTIKNTKYVSLLRGEASISSSPTSEEQVIEVRSRNEQTAGINLNDEVLARVQKIKNETVFVRIICVNGKPISQELDGVIKKKDVREKEVDKIEMEECFIPGDIVKAFVASYGDSRRIQLRTSGKKFGVVYCRSFESGKLMFPLNFEEFVCPFSKVREKRKVALPEFDEFEETNTGGN